MAKENEMLFSDVIRLVKSALYKELINKMDTNEILEFV